MEPSLIDLLLDVLDSVDEGTDAMQIAKRTIVSTLGFNRMGNKNPITSENIKAWVSLRDDYFEALRRGYSSYAESVRLLLFESTLELISRCFTSKNAGTLLHKLSLRWKI